MLLPLIVISHSHRASATFEIISLSCSSLMSILTLGVEILICADVAFAVPKSIVMAEMIKIIFFIVIVFFELYIVCN